MAVKNAPKTMVDATGAAIPIKYVSKFDRDRDALARRIEKRWTKARKDLERVLADSLADLRRFCQANDIARNAQGNLQLSSFDSLIQISVEQSYQIILDTRVATAREKMIGFARRALGKAAGTSNGEALLAIIEQAFSANRAGILPYAKILALLRITIDDPDWIAAKKLLSESILPQRGKAYLRVAKRPSTQAKWQNLQLNVADCWPEGVSFAPATVSK